MDESGEDINPCRRVPPNPIPVFLNDRWNAPPEYDIVSHRSKKIEVEYLIDYCTGCGMEGIETTIDLHSHIIECAKKMEYERIEKAVNKRRHLLS